MNIFKKVSVMTKIICLFLIFVYANLIAIGDHENPIEQDTAQPTACHMPPSSNILSTQVCASVIFKRFRVFVSDIYGEIRSALSRSELSSSDSKDCDYTKGNFLFNMTAQEAKQFLDQCGPGIIYVF